MGIIEWLNANDGVVIGIATVVLVGITSYYAYLTWRMLKANNTPEIAISLRLHEVHVNLVLLCIENIGTGAARDLQFTINPSSIPNLDISFEEIGFLQNGIAYFEQGRKIEQFIVSVTNKLDELKQTPFEIGIKYKDSVGHNHDSSFHLDFGVNEGMAHIDRPPLFEIARATKDMQRDIRNIATGIYKPIILTETEAEHRMRQRANALESRIEQLPNEVQEEILQEFAVAVTKREKEAREKEQNVEPTSDENTS
ncbi:MAG: hypothetical protein OXU23_06485 [Candidatus Poribacteria bacterium]|nr:hypothetical protein [Candidatus Poribacteria bacterium]